ncbi:MAG: DUF1924 domain-containing protein [Oceanicoccus sp.]
MKTGFVRLVMTVIVSVIFPILAQASDVSDELIAEFQLEAAEVLSAEQGAALWERDFDGRSCTTCHTDSLYGKGRHQKTGKIIEPMAPSVNPERLSDKRKVKKWLLRNCKWTLGRECTAREKGEVLLWLSQQ